MPDVIIKDMEMPNCCRGCVMYDTMSCRVLHRDVYRHAAVTADRPEDCPLRPARSWISVDQHGPVDSGWYWAWIVEPGYDEGEMVPSYYYARYDEWQSIECGIACSLPNHSILRIMPMQFPEPPTGKEADQ